MKKILNFIILGVSVLAFSACSPSTIRNKSDFEWPEGVTIPENLGGEMELPETSKYTIPADAETGENGGPGAMETTAVDYSYYPDDKQPVEYEEIGTMVILYVPTRLGITTHFDYVDTCDAESLIDVLIQNNALTDDIEMMEFEVSEDGRSAELNVSGATSVYAAATEDMVVTAIANTFIDNFSLDEITMIVDGEEFGTRGFSQEYDAVKDKEETKAAQ